MKPTPDLNRNDSNRNDYGRYRKLSSNLSFLNPAVSEFRVWGQSSAKKAPPPTPVPGCWPSVSSGGLELEFQLEWARGAEIVEGSLVLERKAAFSSLGERAVLTAWLPGAPALQLWVVSRLHTLTDQPLHSTKDFHLALSFLDFPLKSQVHECFLLSPLCAQVLRFVPSASPCVGVGGCS